MKHTLTLFLFSFLLSVSMSAQSWTLIPYEDINPDGLRIISLYQDADGNVWGGNGYSGIIIRFDGTNWETFNSSITGLFGSAYISDIIQDSGGKMWFTSNDGVATWENGNWVNYKTDNSDIPSDVASAIIEEDGKMWFSFRRSIGSYDGTNWTNIDIPDANTNTGGIASMGNGSFFVSMLNGDPIRRYDGSNWEVFTTDNSNINSMYQYYVERVDDKTFWFGGPNGRANLYEDGSWTPSDDITGWTLGFGGYITGIAANGSKDDSWFSNGDGLFHLKDGVGTMYDFSNSPITSDEVHSVTIDNDGNIWIGTENEILILDPDGISSTDELSSNFSMQILTNPVEETLNLKIENEEGSSASAGKLTIYNTMGRPIISHSTLGQNINIDVRNLTSGKYILHFETDKITRSTPFLKL